MRRAGLRLASGHGLVSRRACFAGKAVEVLVRRGTIDGNLLDLILSPQGEYRLPAVVQPKVIFDIGANIGVTAIYFALVYPDARIYCFEPLPDNLLLLRENTAPWRDRITIVPCGVSDRVGHFAYCMSDNPASFGGGGFASAGTDPSRQLQLPLTTLDRAMQDLRVLRVDVLKVDTEGSELPILRGMPATARRDAQAFIGELHGVGDWDVCDMLAESHDLALSKRLGARCFPFLAVRRDLRTSKSAARLATPPRRQAA